MPWPFQRKPTPEAGTRRETTAPLGTQGPGQRSPSLAALVSELTGTAGRRILDLGAASGSNVEFFSRFRCKLQIVDLPGALTSGEQQPLLKRDPAAAWRRVLPTGGDPVDAVLAWDVLNYLSRDQVRTLTGELAKLCRSGALMLAFISTAKDMPESPSGFKIVDGQSLVVEPHTIAIRPSPRYPPAEVEKLTAGFAVVHAVRMRYGVQEYLFRKR